MEKRFKSGLILGKFMPLHKGHLNLIQKGLNKVDKLTILCCTLESEPIDGILRWNWMMESIKEMNTDKIILKHIYENLPQEPKNNNDIEFWNIWNNVIKRECDDIDLIISSEDYGDKLAELLNIEHYAVDKERNEICISATKIRKEPLKYFNYLADSVKPFYKKRIIFIGPESTGKTKLTNLISNKLNLPKVDEFGRTWSNLYLNNDNKLSNTNFDINDIEIIANQCLKNEDNIIKKSNFPWLICDTDILATMVWSYMYFKYCPQWIIEKTLNNKYKNDLYLLCFPDLEWDDDGTREFSDLGIRLKHYHMIEDELIKRKLNYHIVSGKNDNRIFNALKYIYKYLNNE